METISKFEEKKLLYYYLHRQRFKYEMSDDVHIDRVTPNWTRMFCDQVNEQSHSLMSW